MELSRPLITNQEQNLVPWISVEGLKKSNPVAHKWTVPYRSLVLREALSWRMHDLGRQILLLSDAGHFLGARILLRSAVETLAVLTLISYKAELVMNEHMNYFDYAKFTWRVLCGTKNNSTPIEAVNILTAMDKTEKIYPELRVIYDELCETAHPNFDGVLLAYSSSNPELLETSFKNQCVVHYGAQQDRTTARVYILFEHEYNETWPKTFERFESWLTDHDAELEVQKSKSDCC